VLRYVCLLVRYCVKVRVSVSKVHVSVSKVLC
jgi:hypothetical protein